MNPKLLVGILTITLISILNNDAGTQLMDKKETELFNYQTIDQVNAWNTVNDVVMGGISSSGFEHTSRQTALFSGTVSLENNGGFASVRAYVRDMDLSNHSGMVIRVKGDGKQYSFRIRTNSQFDGVSYSKTFKTEKQKWLEITLPFSEFKPTFRGRILRNVRKISPENIRQIGFLISDKQDGRFELEIDWIKAY